MQSSRVLGIIMYKISGFSLEIISNKSKKGIIYAHT